MSESATTVFVLSQPIVCAAFLTPANGMLSVELANLATILDDADIAPNVSAQAKQWSQSIKEAIYEHAVGSDLRVAIHTT